MRQKLLSVLVLAVISVAGCSRSPVLVKVGGTAITDADLETLAEINPRLKPRLATPPGKQKILENYVEQTLLYREATRRGLERENQTRKKLDLYKKIIVAQSVLDDELNKKVKEYFDNHTDEFERVNLSHILIRTVADESQQAKDKQKKKSSAVRSDALAQQLIEKVQARLAKGEDFAKVASELSEDARTKPNQGNLGYVTIRDKRLERFGWLPLAETAFALKEGEVSGPVKTKDGFHLIKVTEVKKMQPLEEADPGIRFRIQQDVRTVLLEDLKKKYAVKYTTPPAGGEAAPAAATLPAPAAPEAPSAAPAAPTPSAPAAALGQAAPATPAPTQPTPSARP